LLAQLWVLPSSDFYALYGFESLFYPLCSSRFQDSFPFLRTFKDAFPSPLEENPHFFCFFFPFCVFVSLIHFSFFSWDLDAFLPGLLVLIPVSSTAPKVRIVFSAVVPQGRLPPSLSCIFFLKSSIVEPLSKMSIFSPFFSPVPLLCYWSSPSLISFLGRTVFFSGFLPFSCFPCTLPLLSYIF